MTISVCVPVWNGEAFVAETLESIRAQSLADFRVMISVDRSDDRSCAVCQQYAEQDPRFVVFAQSERLGWVGNVNWLLRRVETPYACIVPHDDLLSPTYLEALGAKLAATPSAVLAYCDIELFGHGDQKTKSVQPATSGSAFERVMHFITENRRAVAWRGVFRTHVLTSDVLHDEVNRAAADQVWLLRLAILGDCVRVPQVLYRKRLHRNSVVSQTLTEGTFDQVWVDHCVSCHEIALAAVSWREAEKQAIALACFQRALVPGLNSPSRMLKLASTYKERLASRLYHVADRPDSPALPKHLKRQFRRSLQRHVLMHYARALVTRTGLRRRSNGRTAIG